MTSNVSDRVEKQVLALAAADPTLTHTQLAAMVNRSTKTIQRIMKANAPTLDEIDSKLRAVQTAIKERLPVEKRVEILASIAESSELDFARISTVKYVNELDGIHPQLERDKVKSTHDAPTTQPMFMLPPGSTVNVTVSTPRDERVIDVKAQETEES